jgi:uncharacterized protein (TIGR02145 family)
MKIKIILSIVAFAVMAGAYCQKPVMELTFTAVNNTSYAQLDHIKVINRTLGTDTVLYYPDTVLMFDTQVGITNLSQERTGLKVFQNYPNPVEDQTTITLYVPEKGNVDIMITDILGKKIIHTGSILDKGYHSFRFTPGMGNLFFFTAQWNGHSSSIKVLHAASVSNTAGSLDYIGIDNAAPYLKTADAVQRFTFRLGDDLLYVGYFNTWQSGILDSLTTSKTYVFQFATNMPCPGTPTVTYGGQVYNTIQIFNQCWLKENLNVGTMIPGTQEMTNNSVIEKYCYEDNPANCVTYGGLYQWDEVMQYTTQQNKQGICPPGWHIPGDEEWKVLEGSVDSQYGIGDTEWDSTLWRGYDAGLNLKALSGWSGSGNGTDLFGFSGLPGGTRDLDGTFISVGSEGYWWASEEYYPENIWCRFLNYNNSDAFRYYYYHAYGFNVRCMKD